LNGIYGINETKIYHPNALRPDGWQLSWPRDNIQHADNETSLCW